MGAVRGVPNSTELERIEFEAEGESYCIDIMKLPPARVWNREIRRVIPNESQFDYEIRLLLATVMEWNIGLEISKESIEALDDLVFALMSHYVAQYYKKLQDSRQDILQNIYRPAGDGEEADPTHGTGTASASRKPSTSRRTR